MKRQLLWNSSTKARSDSCTSWVVLSASSMITTLWGAPETRETVDGKLTDTVANSVYETSFIGTVDHNIGRTNLITDCFGDGGLTDTSRPQEKQVRDLSFSTKPLNAFLILAGRMQSSIFWDDTALPTETFSSKLQCNIINKIKILVLPFRNSDAWTPLLNSRLVAGECFQL